LTTPDPIATPNTPDVLRGAEGHLFLSGGHHRVMEHFTGKITPDPRSIESFLDNAETRKLACARAGVPSEAVVFPEKLYALRRLVDFPVRSLLKDVYLSSPGNRGLAEPFYPAGPLAQSDSYALTDTHLSLTGAVTVLEALLKPRFDAEWPAFLSHLDDHTSPLERFIGDLGKKFDPPLRERAVRYIPPEAITFEHNGVRGMNEGVILISENLAAITQQKLLIFGDSYFRMLMPQLAYFYRTIIFCRTRFFHHEVVDSVAPDVIFTGMAERYLTNCTPDHLRSNLFTVPMLRGKVTRPTPGFPEIFARAFDGRKLI